MSSQIQNLSPQELRQQIRSGQYQGNTSGCCAGFVQCNMVILPSDWAADFLKFCQDNPKPCPLIALSEPGEFSIPKLGADQTIKFLGRILIVCRE